MSIEHFTLIFYFVAFNFLSIYVRTRAKRFLKEEYKRKLTFGQWGYLSNDKFQDKKGILLRNLSNGITVIGGIIFFILYSVIIY